MEVGSEKEIREGVCARVNMALGVTFAVLVLISLHSCR
jgi:hypothetical protein